MDRYMSKYNLIEHMNAQVRKVHTVKIDVEFYLVGLPNHSCAGKVKPPFANTNLLIEGLFINLNYYQIFNS